MDYFHPSAVDLVSEALLAYMEAQGLAEGDRLPCERELVALLRTSRSTLREALQRLCTRNILEVRRGVGIFVSYKRGVVEDPLGFALMHDQQKLAEDLLAFRMLIEPQMAALAAQHATDEDLAKLAYLCHSMEHLIHSGKPHLERDQEFHTCIARCSGNSIMPKILPIIHGSIGVFITTTKGMLKEETIRTHRAIFNAIRAHDPVAAFDAMHLHLIYNRDRFRTDAISYGGCYTSLETP